MFIVIGGIFIISVFFTIKTQAQQIMDRGATASAMRPTSTRTASPTIDVGATGTELWFKEYGGRPWTITPGPSPTITFTPTLTPTFIPRGSKPPRACTFPLPQTTTTESVPMNYIFSQPQVVMEENRGEPDSIEAMKAISTSIISWLPDNQTVLIARSRLIDSGYNGDQRTIERYNPVTKETHVYAQHMNSDHSRVVWNPASNTVIYRTRKIIGEFNNNAQVARELVSSDGNPENVQILDGDPLSKNSLELLADHLRMSYDFAVKPDGSQIAYFIGGQFVKMDSSLKALPPIYFDFAQWDYLNTNRPHGPVYDYKMEWRPNSSLILLYAHANYDASYIYLLDTNTGQPCNLNFDGWIYKAHWSPNGRYLAAIRGHGIWTGPNATTDLAVLDTATGKLYTLKVDAEIKNSRQFITDIAWVPDNRHILIEENIYSYEDEAKDVSKLFLGDFMAGKVKQVLPSYPFQTRAGSTDLAWSPDGSKLLVHCAIKSKNIDRICLMSVQQTPE